MVLHTAAIKTTSYEANNKQNSISWRNFEVYSVKKCVTSEIMRSCSHVLLMVIELFSYCKINITHTV